MVLHEGRACACRSPSVSTRSASPARRLCSSFQPMSLSGWALNQPLPQATLRELRACQAAAILAGEGWRAPSVPSSAQAVPRAWISSATKYRSAVGSVNHCAHVGSPSSSASQTEQTNSPTPTPFSSERPARRAAPLNSGWATRKPSRPYRGVGTLHSFSLAALLLEDV